jgi:hypothetical protein
VLCKHAQAEQLAGDAAAAQALFAKAQDLAGSLTVGAESDLAKALADAARRLAEPPQGEAISAAAAIPG